MMMMMMTLVDPERADCGSLWKNCYCRFCKLFCI